MARDDMFRNTQGRGSQTGAGSRVRAAWSYLLVDHQVAHALCGCLPELVVILKHVVLNIWQGFLLDYLHPVEESSQMKQVTAQEITSVQNINCRQRRLEANQRRQRWSSGHVVHSLPNAD